jgi:hypothetical protein
VSKILVEEGGWEWGGPQGTRRFPKKEIDPGLGNSTHNMGQLLGGVKRHVG